MSRRVVVYGPAYLDRVLRVDGPLLHPSRARTLDRGTEARAVPGGGKALILIDPMGGRLTIEPPDGWPGPRGRLQLADALDSDADHPWKRELQALNWHDDLGGMGAGFASALGGRLVCVLGVEPDPTSQGIEALLLENGIANHPIRTNHAADWTLMITSGEHGDKLPLGFRGCLAALDSTRSKGLITRAAFVELLREHASPGLNEAGFPEDSSGVDGDGEIADSPPAVPEISPDSPPDLVVVASLTNRLAASALQAWPEAIRVLAPAMRNVADRNFPLGSLAGIVDIVCGNREEWETLPASDRERFETRLSLQAITDGPGGAVVRFRGESGGWEEAAVPAFPRRSDPRDTNRAGEAFASTLIATLLDSGWRPGPADPALIREAALRASAAAAIELELVRFGFPTPEEIETALRAGIVEPLALDQTGS